MTLKLDELEVIAQEATREALKDYPPFPDAFMEELTRGIYFEGDTRVFELYLSKDTPTEAVVLTRVKVDSRTGEVGEVEIFSEHWAGQPDGDTE